MTLRVFLAGEGAGELGGWAGHPVYRNPNRPGFLEQLAGQVAPSAWKVCGAIEWKRIKKLKVNAGKEHIESKHVRAAALHASEEGCDVLLFSRDEDGPPGPRTEAIERALDGQLPIPVAGAAAAPNREGWLLALTGRQGTEQLRSKRATEEWEKLGTAEQDVIASCDPKSLPADAVSLRRWVERVERVLRTR